MNLPKPIAFVCAVIACTQVFAQNQAIIQPKNFSGIKKASFNFAGDGFSLTYDSTTGKCEIVPYRPGPDEATGVTTEQQRATQPASGLTYLVKDIDRDADSYPQDAEFNTFNWYYAVLNKIVYFAADDGIHGSELWRSDGTDSGTYILADINPGVDGSSPTNIIVAGNKIFFAATTASRGKELWVSDGSADGTRLVRDILSQSQSSYPEAITNVNGVAYFLVSLAHYHDQLWKSDGTQNGTTMVKDLYGNGLLGGVYQFTAVNNLLFFTAGSTATGQELWRSDGTDYGTFMVSDINQNSASSYPAQLTIFNNKLYFSAFDGASRLLWQSDGSGQGTHPVNGNNNVQLPAGSTLPFVIAPFAISNNSIYFMGYSASTGWELYDYADPTGVVLVADVVPGTEGYYMGNSYRPEMVDVSGILCFRYKDSVKNNYQLWGSSATRGTKRIKVFPSGSFFNNLVCCKDMLYFIAFDSTYGTELWKSNGTTNGTMPMDIYPGRTSSYAMDLTPVGNKLFFSAASKTTGFELWQTTAHATNATLVKDINQTTTSSSGAGAWSGFGLGANGKVVFGAYERETGFEMYTTDGTAAGTTLVQDLKPGEYDSGPYILLSKNGSVYFSASDSTTYGVYKTDGTAQSVVKVINDGQVNDLDVTNNGLVFYIRQPGNYYQLWRSDGTVAGTYMLVDTLPLALYGYPPVIRAVGNTLFFAGQDPVNGVELWKTDGTLMNTGPVKNINPGSLSSYPYSFYGFDGELYFGATDSTGTASLWKTDGTDVGTTNVKDITPVYDFRYGYLRYFSISKNVLYLTANTTTDGSEVWRSNGTSTGTKLLKNIVPGSGSSNPVSLTNVNDTLFFTADDGIHGQELWKSDGTGAGTVMVTDLTATGGTPFSTFATAGGKLFFSINNTTLWVSDGTDSGTYQISDNKTSQIGNIIGSNGKIYFSAYTYKKGQELYAVDAAALIPAAVVTEHIAKQILPVNKFTVRLLENPISNRLQLIAASTMAQSVNITITNISGKKMIEEKTALQKGSSLLTFSCNTWAPGIYMINIKATDGSVIQLKAIK